MRLSRFHLALPALVLTLALSRPTFAGTVMMTYEGHGDAVARDGSNGLLLNTPTDVKPAKGTQEFGYNRGFGTVPDPGTWMLLGTGLLGLACAVRKSHLKAVSAKQVF